MATDDLVLDSVAGKFQSPSLHRLDTANRHAWCQVALIRADRHRPCLRFRDAEAVANWLALCPAALPASAFRIVVQIDTARDADEALTQWRTILGPEVALQSRRIAVQTSRSLTGRGLLTIVKGGGQQESRSFQALRRAAFLTMVLEEMRQDL